MESISQVVFKHYQAVASSTTQSWDAMLAEPIERFLAANIEADPSVVSKLRDLNTSADLADDMRHNRQYVKRHFENGQLRADMLPFLIKFAPQPEDLLHSICALFGVLPVSAEHILGTEHLPANHYQSIGSFSENSGKLTSLFSSMVATGGGLGPEDKPYVPSLLRLADKAISWASNIKMQAQKITD